MFKEDSRARQTVEGANLFFAFVRQLQCPWASRPKRRKGYPAGSLVCYPSLPSVQEKFYHEGDGRIAVEPVSAFALRASERASERGIHYVRVGLGLGCSAGKKRRQFVMISSGRSSLPPASLMPVLATRRSVMRTFRLDESVNLSSQSERISKSSMVPHIFSAFCSVGESLHLPDLATNFCAVKLIFQLEPARFAFPGCTRTHMPRLPRRAVRCL